MKDWLAHLSLHRMVNGGQYLRSKTLLVMSASANVLVCDHISFVFVRLSDARLVRTVYNAPRLKQKPSRLY